VALEFLSLASSPKAIPISSTANLEGRTAHLADAGYVYGMKEARWRWSFCHLRRHPKQFQFPALPISRAGRHIWLTLATWLLSSSYDRSEREFGDLLAPPDSTKWSRLSSTAVAQNAIKYLNSVNYALFLLRGVREKVVEVRG
jgi:hypothetical protein